MSTVEVFERLARRYDAWYEGPAGSVLFTSELACLRPLLRPCSRPWLEIGVGSGRFASALGVETGVDPAGTPLRSARSRGIHVAQGVGERLPVRSGAVGAALIVVTVCFADDPGALLAEARRVLRPGGAVILGLVFADSDWGRFYQREAAAGHPFYAAARFLTRTRTAALLHGAGLRCEAARSTLYQPPTDHPVNEPARDGDAPDAGFVAWRAIPTATEDQAVP